MITTDFVPGSPCWLDLGAPDVRAAADFYGAVFDWQAESFDPEHSYSLFRRDGKIVGAVGELTEAGAKPAWMIYFHTADADATVAAVERAGGTVRVPPAEVPAEQGRMAQLTDPQGAQFAVWELGEHKGIELADAPGSLGWTELYTVDSPAAQEFYGNVFGWTTQDVPLPGGGGTYTLVTPADSGDERMHGGIMAVPGMFDSGQKPYWHPVFGTTDCDATVARVTEKGGNIAMGPEDAEGVGRLAVVTDPTEAEFVVLKPAEMSG